MTIEQSIIERLEYAVKYNHTRTARARARDLAHHRSDRDGTPYQEHLYNILTQYSL